MQDFIDTIKDVYGFIIDDYGEYIPIAVILHILSVVVFIGIAYLFGYLEIVSMMHQTFWDKISCFAVLLIFASIVHIPLGLLNSSEIGFTIILAIFILIFSIATSLWGLMAFVMVAGFCIFVCSSYCVLYKDKMIGLAVGAVLMFGGCQLREVFPPPKPHITERLTSEEIYKDNPNASWLVVYMVSSPSFSIYSSGGYEEASSIEGTREQAYAHANTFYLELTEEYPNSRIHSRRILFCGVPPEEAAKIGDTYWVNRGNYR